MADPNSRARILAAIHAIARGQVAGYGDVATRAGLPGRARLVARVLATHAEDDLPWHRVLRSDGRIAFADGSEGRKEQVRRLRAEGVVVTDGRVRIGREEQGMDALVWGDIGPSSDDAGRSGRAAGKGAGRPRRPSSR